MTEVERGRERLEFIWVVGAMIVGFRFAFGVTDIAIGSLHPEITRFMCGSVLGFVLGGSAAITGLPFVHFVADLRDRALKKGKYDRTQPTDSKNTR